jgi:DNA-binding NtrC family response regulator
MERAAVLAGSAPISAEHLPADLTGEAVRAPGTAHAAEAPVLRDEMLHLERRRILEALDACGGNQTKAAELLGMPRRTFVKRLDEYGILRPRKRPPSS